VSVLSAQSVARADSLAITVANDEFLAGALVSVGTFVRHHPEIPVRVLHDGERVPLSSANQRRIEALSKSVKCVEAGDSEFWAHCDDLAERLRTPQHLRAAFLILKAFAAQSRRVVAFDSDLLFLAPCPELFDQRIMFGAVRALDGEGEWPRGFFNSGLVTVGECHLTGSTYEDLLRNTRVHGLGAGVGRADQALLNAYFTPPRMTFLDRALNVSKRSFADDRGDISELLRETKARVVHYVGKKPWQRDGPPHEQRYSGVEEMWWRALEQIDAAVAEEWRERV
jgi:lipopolysaccharide biosynthesis glycosyltransferase